MFDLIEQRGHRVLALPKLLEGGRLNLNDTPHVHWLGTDWSTDARDTQQALNADMGNIQLDWLVVDHYAIDARWEGKLRVQAKHIMVVDDLADRPHVCDLLLDQTFGRQIKDYINLVPERCQLMCGSQYALLRPEFSALREYSLKRRAKPVLKELLITMGGVDKDNVTGGVMRALQACSLPDDLRLTIVMGQTAPWVQNIQELAGAMSKPTRVLIGVANMAQLMADSDLAIGAAGGTSWERCHLGLPSIIIVTADNQLKVAKELEQVGAAKLCLPGLSLQRQFAILLDMFSTDTKSLAKLKNAAARVVDSDGLSVVLKLIMRV